MANDKIYLTFNLMHEGIVQWQIDKKLYNFQNMHSREWNIIVEFTSHNLGYEFSLFPTCKARNYVAANFQVKSSANQMNTSSSFQYW